MSGSLEGVIRPFETGDVSPAKPLPQGEAPEPPDNLVIEAKGSPPHTFTGNFSVDITYYHVKKPKEKKEPGAESVTNPAGPPPVAGNESPPAGYP
jgi:hypothetical protein